MSFENMSVFFLILQFFASFLSFFQKYEFSESRTRKLFFELQHFLNRIFGMKFLLTLNAIPNYPWNNSKQSLTTVSAEMLWWWLVVKCFTLLCLFFCLFKLCCNKQRLLTSKYYQAFLLHSPRKQRQGKMVLRYLTTFFSDQLRQSWLYW